VGALLVEAVVVIKKLELLHSEPHGNKEIWEIISDELRKDNKAYYLL
jgi:hypothetical protein